MTLVLRFLVDNALSPDLRTALSDAGFDAQHVRDIGLHQSDDVLIFDRAAAEGRIIVSADTDFGALLAQRSVVKPSVILFRGEVTRVPSAQALVLLANLPQIASSLQDGAIVVLDPPRIRVRLLPL